MAEKEPWVLIERYVDDYPNDWTLVFKRGEAVLKIAVPEEVWRTFDSVTVKEKHE